MPKPMRDELNKTRFAQPDHPVESMHFFRCDCGAVVDKRKLGDVLEHAPHGSRRS